MPLQHAATHRNTPQHTAAHFDGVIIFVLHINTPPPILHPQIPCHCSTLQHTAPHYTTLQHTATHLDGAVTFVLHIRTQPPILHPHIPRHCNTLQHTATHCTTLQHTLMVLSYFFCTSTPHRPSLTQRCRGHCSSGPPLCPHPAHPEPSRAASGRSLPRGMSPSGPVAARRWYVEGGGRGRATRRSSNRNESPKILECLSHVTLKD